MLARAPGTCGERTGNANGRPHGQPGAIIARGPCVAPCDHDRVISRRAGVAAGAAALLLGILPTPVFAHGTVPAEAPSLGNLLFSWHVEPVVAIGLLVAVVAWLWIVRRVARMHPGNGVAAWRSAAFFGGLFAVAVALMSGIERYDTTLFSIHMVQHLLLMLVAGPLLVLAAPVTQLLRAT